MAGRNTFEEVLRLVIEAGGKDDVELLLKQLDALQTVSAGGSKATLELAEKLKSLAATAGQIQAYTKLKGEITETAAAIAKESEKLVKLKSDIDAAEKPSAALTRTYEKSQSALDKLLAAQNRQSVALQNTERQLVKAGVDTSKLGESYQKLQHEMDGTQKNLKAVAEGAGKVATETNKAGGSVDKLKNSSTGAAEALKSIALRFSAVAIAAEIAHKTLQGGEAFFDSAIESSAGLESALVEVGAVTGATTEQMKALKAAAEDAAHTTKFSALEAAKGLTELGRAGFNADEAVKALPATLHLAQAAGIEVADAATLVVQTLTEFKRGAGDAAHVADLLAKGAKSGGLGLQGLAEELAKTAPFAHQLNLDATDTVAILAALAKEGLRGRIAAGGLRDAFTELADPTSKFSTQLLELGIHSRDFNQVIVELSKRGAEGRRAIESLSTNGRVAITALVADGGAKIRELQGDLKGAAGTAEETAKAMDDSLAGGFNAIGKSYEELKVALLEPVLGPLKDELRELATEMDKVAKSPDFAEIRKALGELFVEGIKGVNEFIHSIDLHKLAENIKSFVGDAKTTITDFRNNLGEIITTVKAVYEAFKFAFHVIEAGILLLVDAVVHLVAAFADVEAKLVHLANWDPTGLRHKLGTVSDEAVRTADNIAGAAHAASDSLDKRLGQAISDASDNFSDLSKTVSDGSEGASKSLGAVAQATTATADALETTATAGTDAATGLDATTAAAEKTTDAQDKAAQAAKDLDAQLKLLGVTTQAELVRHANEAANAYHAVVEQFHAGKLAIEDVRRAYVAYAQAQRESVAVSDHWKQAEVESQLAVQAQVDGVTESLHHMGIAGEEAGHQIVHGAGEATVALKHTAAAAKEAANSGDDLSASMKDSSFSLGRVSDALAEAYRYTNRYVGNQYEWRTAINGITQEWRRQSKAIQDVNDALDAQLAKEDPLASRVSALKAQYKYVDDATLRALAEKQQRVADEAKRTQDDAARAEADRSKGYLAEVARDRAGAGSGAAAGDGSHPLTNPNLGSGDHVTLHHVIDLNVPKDLTHLSAEQRRHLVDSLLAELRRDLETMLKR